MTDERISVRAYVSEMGKDAFGDFLDNLRPAAAAKVVGVVEKLERGHKSGLKHVGGGVAEWILDWGPGVRVYVHEDGDTLILLMGGSYGKSSQSAEIADAKTLVREYKRRKKALSNSVSADGWRHRQDIIR